MYLQLVAHEIAHNLGIYHDFDPKNGGNNRQGTGDCSVDRLFSIMSYGQQREIWSKCSRDNFKDYYNELLSKNIEKNFEWCMKGKLL